MTEYRGKSVYPGIAIGPIHVLKKASLSTEAKHTSNPKEEIKRYEAAVDTAMAQLKDLYAKAIDEVGQEDAAIFEMHQMMLQDENYTESVHSIINNQSVNAEFAVAETSRNLSEIFAAMDDEYMSARAVDIKDISDRIISVLSGAAVSKCTFDYTEPVIVVAEDLTPSETLMMDKNKVLSFVTIQGSANSHTAILAKTLALPSLIGCQLVLDDNLDGKIAIVDGQKGLFIVDPDEKTLAKMQIQADEAAKEKDSLQVFKGKPAITKAGKAIKVYANIGNLSDLSLALENDAEGIGLFRSEFIYLEREDYPTEEEQFEIYKELLEGMKDKEVIIRTLDIGADKQCPYFNLDKEDNPALGLRAIRICLTRPEIFTTQLRALFRASCYGNLSVMYPMITSLWEIKKIKEIEKEVEEELKAEGLSYKLPRRGIMIETPAAVMISDVLAKEVDFFSIGTNDLTQYTLAVDRQNSRLDEFTDSHHPAILAMLKMTIDNAHKNGIPVGICGNLAADSTLTDELIQMGVDELSVSPGLVLGLKKNICNL